MYATSLLVIMTFQYIITASKDVLTFIPFFYFYSLL